MANGIGARPMNDLDNLTQSVLHDNPNLIALGIALSLGLLIGAQRGWADRARAAGERIAGVRTHALTGLLGGCAGLMTPYTSPWTLGAVLIAVAWLCVTAYRERLQRTQDFSITGAVGLMLTCVFGAMATLGEPVTAASAAVITAILLDNKREIHGFLQRLQEHELDAALKLLLISVVMLPLLPNTGFGPGGVINPYQVWWMVVLIASISFIGYFAVRFGGTEKGILFTSLFAGLSSSTALTLHFSRLSRDNPTLSPLLAAGILAACGTMFPRILLVCLVLSPALAKPLFWPAGIMMLMLYGPAIAIWLRHRRSRIDQPPLHQNPLELKSALLFGLVLLIILVLAQVLRDAFGDTGLLLLAALSGITDVDPVTLSVTRLANEGLESTTAVLAIIIAASVNSLVKTGMAIGIADRGVGQRVGLVMSLAVATGLLSAWLI